MMFELVGPKQCFGNHSLLQYQWNQDLPRFLVVQGQLQKAIRFIFLHICAACATAADAASRSVICALRKKPCDLAVAPARHRRNTCLPPSNILKPLRDESQTKVTPAAATCAFVAAPARRRRTGGSPPPTAAAGTAAAVCTPPPPHAEVRMR